MGAILYTFLQINIKSILQCKYRQWLDEFIGNTFHVYLNIVLKVK